MLRGAYPILSHIEAKLGVKKGETTPDGKFTIVEEECLAACADAPMMICGTEYFLNLTPEKVDAALARLAKNPISEHVD
jgi:NADH-quinone oxidoreductase subunit E